MKAALIVNSLAAGRCSAAWQPALEFLSSSNRLTCEIITTETAGQAAILSKEVAEAGHELIVAVGGDGTVNECVNGIMTGGNGSQRAVLGTIPLGSGCDFARSLGIPREPLAAARLLESGCTRLLDVGLVEYSCRSGERRRRFFINVADVGAGGVVVREAARCPRFLGRRPNYLWGMLAAVVKYRPKTVNLRVDDLSPISLCVRNVVIANGRYFGRGFNAAPQASMNDGMLDIVSLGDYTTLESIIHLPKLHAGTHLSLDKVRHFQGEKATISSNEEVLLELDGELVGILPASFEVVPQTLGVICTMG